jgi:hypothetical protein
MRINKREWETREMIQQRLLRGNQREKNKINKVNIQEYNEYFLCFSSTSPLPTFFISTVSKLQLASGFITQNVTYK